MKPENAESNHNYSHFEYWSAPGYIGIYREETIKG